MTNIEELVAEYGTVMKAYGRSLGVGDRLIAIDHSGSADRRFEAIRNALTEQAETHAMELRAYETTVQNLEQRIRQMEAERVPSPSCRECANRGRVNGLSQETYCDSCVWQGQSFRVNQYAAAPQQKKEGE